MLLLCEIPGEANNLEAFTIHDGRELYIVLSRAIWTEPRPAVRNARHPMVPPLRKFLIALDTPFGDPSPPSR